LELTPQDAEGIGILILGNLDQIYSATCCYRCCLPCGYIWKLAQDGTKLETLLRQAPAEHVQVWLNDYDSERQDKPGHISREWLFSRLQGVDDEPCPNEHEET